MAVYCCPASPVLARLNRGRCRSVACLCQSAGAWCSASGCSVLEPAPEFDLPYPNCPLELIRQPVHSGP